MDERISTEIEKRIQATASSSSSLDHSENMAEFELELLAENEALAAEVAGLQSDARRLADAIEEAKRGEKIAARKMEKLSALSLSTEARLREELAQALQLADAALSSTPRRQTVASDGGGGEETVSLRDELRASEEQAAGLSSELGLLTDENVELQGAVTALSASVAAESETAVVRVFVSFYAGLYRFVLFLYRFMLFLC